MASQFVYWTSDGGGALGKSQAQRLHAWIMAQKNAQLIVYGGDVYNNGLQSEFAAFLAQMGGDVSLMCETPGNHDWRNPSDHTPQAIPVGYEHFWSQYPPPLSRQPIDTAKTAGARYEHFHDFNGWRFIFLDTGALELGYSWPMGDESRVDWLKKALTGAPRSRASIVLAHHSRLSWGQHGDNPKVSRLWEALFDDNGRPLASCTISGHDHNVSVYKFRNRALQTVATAPEGIQLWVNGAGGDGYYPRTLGTKADMLYPLSKSPHDDPPMFCVTRIEVVDATHAKVSLLSLGTKPQANTAAKVIVEQTYDV